MTIDYENALGYPRRAEIHLCENNLYHVKIWDMIYGEFVAGADMNKQEVIDFFAHYDIKVFEE